MGATVSLHWNMDRRQRVKKWHEGLIFAEPVIKFQGRDMARYKILFLHIGVMWLFYVRTISSGINFDDSS
jgi:hypothetical protein